MFQFYSIWRFRGKEGIMVSFVIERPTGHLINFKDGFPMVLLNKFNLYRRKNAKVVHEPRGAFLRFTLNLILILMVFTQPLLALDAAAPTGPADEECLPSHWAGSGYKLKDHAIFYADGYYYGASIYLSEQNYEDRFAYARSADLCTWTELPPILTQRTPGTWDDFRVWAPFVIREGDPSVTDPRYFMFYTGVTADITQSIMLATTTTPQDPASWQPQGMVFQPDHPGMDWAGRGKWSDARDPMVVYSQNRYYLYYTGLDTNGGIVGVAVADSLSGPWQDLGSTLTLAQGMPESPSVMEKNGFFFLIYNHAGTKLGAQMRMAPSPTGPWSSPTPVALGWAHEFFQAIDGSWMTSYLTDYSVTVDRLDWVRRGTIDWPVVRFPWQIWLPQVVAD